MSNPQRLPRKYLNQIQDAQTELRSVGQKIRTLLELLENPTFKPNTIIIPLKEVESCAYRIALALAELRFTDDCTGCPNAPASTPARIHLMVLADELERQADLARQMASPPTVELTAQEEVFPFLVEKVAEFSHVEFPLGSLGEE